MRCITQADREAAAARRTTPSPAVTKKFAGVDTGSKKGDLHSPFVPSTGKATPPAVMCDQPGGATCAMGPSYFNQASWANSPLPQIGVPNTGMRKFVDGLPGLGSGNQNNLGQYIPLAVPFAIVPPNVPNDGDYYEIGLSEYSQKMHSDLPATLLRGYHDLNPSGDVHNQYLGPLILAHRNKPVRVKFTNNLSPGAAGNLHIPVDTTVMGAGNGPDGTAYMQNRATLHLHGGNTPWISDGTPHQWTVPVGETTATLKKGVSTVDVPDMPASGDGSMTFYWSNQQSGRLMFYHDHSYGITRLNVYAGEAAAYLLVDPIEDTMIGNGVLPTLPFPYTYGIPLVIQDKTFVPDNGIAGGQLSATDPTWDLAKWGGPGSLWFPHTYMTNQNPADDSGANPFGRWDYAEWFWPPQPSLQHPHIACPNPADIDPKIPGVPLTCPATPLPSLVPEAFLDTPVINGTAYPYANVPRQPVRFRILNASNDRTLNLGLYIADPTNVKVGTWGTEVKMVDAVPHTAASTVKPCATAVPLGDAGLPNIPLTLSGFDVPTAQPLGYAACWPSDWPTDGRDGGVPDPATAGPAMIQIGTEGGLLPNPVIIPSTPTNYNYNRRDIVVLNIAAHGLLLGPAERADVIIDFSGVPEGSSVILYNDAPTPVPAFDPRTDYYTGDPDFTATGGAPSTQPGYGPNTRTMLQFRVSGGSGTSFNLAGLQAAFASTATTQGAFAQSQPTPLVPEAAYNTALNTTWTDNFTRITEHDLKVVEALPTTPATICGTLANCLVPELPKGIQELFELDYGRMNATLSVEIPRTSVTTQTTIPYGYVDPPTEMFQDGETQIWKFTHNGVDTHSMHFHLFNVQLINRVGWDGAIRKPDANEIGWKETVRMNPLEDAVIAIKPIRPNVPFAMPDSWRSFDVTMPENTAMTPSQFTNVNPLGNGVTTTNKRINFGWEYVYHCHLLGHEENDMMRPMVFEVAPEPVANLAASWTANPTAAAFTFTDPSVTSTSLTLQKSTDPTFLNLAMISTITPLNKTGNAYSATDSGAFGTPVYYRVVSSKTFADPWGMSYAWFKAAYPTLPTTGAVTGVTNSYSNVVSGPPPLASVTPAPPGPLAFGNQEIKTSTAAQIITLTNAGGSALQISGVVLSDTVNYNMTNGCAGTVAIGANCVISIVFNPQTIAPFPGTVTITDNSNNVPGSTQVINLTGNGIGVPRATLVTSPVQFWTTGAGSTSAPMATTLGNQFGTGVLTYTIGFSSGEFQLAAGGDPCAGSVAAGPFCTISVVAKPIAAGVRNGTMTVTDNNLNTAGSTQSLTLIATPVPLSSVQLSPTSVLGGTPTTNNHVLLSAPAPSAGFVVSLSSNNAAAVVPVSVTIAAGQTSSPAFTITTSAVPTVTPITVTATLNTVSKSAVLTVNPPALTFMLWQNVINGGVRTNANYVGLTGPAPLGNAIVTFSSNNPLAQPPASVTILAGQTSSLVFYIGTTGVTSTQTANITATYNGVSLTRTLTIIPATLTSMFTFPQLTGGTSASLNRVSLNGSAPPGAGIIVSLTSSSPSLTVPATVTVPANANFVTFKSTASTVSANTQVTITATYNGVQMTSTTTVTP